MKYYSELLGKCFDTEKACVEAEEAQKKAEQEAKAKKEALAADRANRAKKIDELYEEVLKAQDRYRQELEAFVKDYGSYHKTYKHISPFSSLFDWF